jgi:hypothetical protein
MLAAIMLSVAAALAFFPRGRGPAAAMADPLWLVVDASRSMRAGTPPRLDLARLGLDSWLAAQGPLLNRPVGLIVFGAHARMVVSPGTDGRLLRSQVARLDSLAEDSALAPGPKDPSGTDLASGIALARSWPIQGSVWIFSDGDDPVRRILSEGAPRADRAWVIGAPGRLDPVPGQDASVVSSTRPDRVRELTRGEVIESGEAPPALPGLGGHGVSVAPAPWAFCFTLAGLTFLLASAVPSRWLAASLMLVAGCSSRDPRDEAGLLILQARDMPASERGPVLRRAEDALRGALARGDDPDLLETLVICLLDQAESDPRAPRLAAEISVRLPAQRAEPLRARARWLEALAKTRPSPGAHGDMGDDGPGETPGDGDSDRGSSRRGRSRPVAMGAAETDNALPGAGRLPIVNEAGPLRALSADEARRLAHAAAERLGPPSANRKSEAGPGVPDW